MRTCVQIHLSLTLLLAAHHIAASQGFRDCPQSSPLWSSAWDASGDGQHSRCVASFSTPAANCCKPFGLSFKPVLPLSGPVAAAGVLFHQEQVGSKNLEQS